MEIFNNILIYFVIVPLLTLGGLALCHNRGIKAIRTVSATTVASRPSGPLPLSVPACSWYLPFGW